MSQIQQHLMIAGIALWLLPATAADLKMGAAQPQQAGGNAPPASPVGSPSMGYIAGPHKLELRTILGVPGAARFSDPLPLPEGTRLAESAPGQAWVLLMGAKGAAAYQPATQTAQALPGGVPTCWAFSPDGSRIALWNRESGAMALVSGLPAAPKLESTLHIANPDSFVLSDLGTLAYRMGSQIYAGSGQTLYQLGSAGPMAFEATREALVVYDAASAGLVEIDLANPAPRLIASDFGSADRLFAASDRVYAGSTTAGRLWTFDYQRGLIANQSVPISRIVPSGIAGTVVVSHEPLGPAWLINADGLSFVPSPMTVEVQ